MDISRSDTVGKLLYRFLKKKGLVDAYISNIYLDSKEIINYVFGGEINKYTIPRGFGHIQISGAFCWERTPQGQRFWGDLNDEFHKEVKKLEKAYNLVF